MDARAFLSELRRRHVMRVAIVYAGAAFVTLEAAELLFPALGIPDTAFRALVVIALIGFPAALALSWAFDVKPASVPAPDEAQDPPPRSIAVLPFTNMSADAENEYFSDGLSEELLNVLSKVPGLRVPARTSSFAFKGEKRDVREVAQRLGVGTVLEGSVRRAGSRVRITAQLVDASNGYHLWSDAYDRDLEDIFAIQAEIAHRIADALQVRLGDPAERALSAAPLDVGAYELYLRGRHYFHRMTRASITAAAELFEKATQRDPSFAPAWAGLSNAHVMLHLWFEPYPTHLEKAEHASARALELDPESPDTHTSVAWVHSLRRRFDEAERHFEQALARDPRNYDALYLFARSRFAEGRHAEAVDLFARAHEARPEEYQAIALRSMSLRELGRTEEANANSRAAIAASERHLELNPDDVRAHYMRAGAYAELGESEPAMRSVEAAIALAPEDSSVLYNAACMYGLLGRGDRALELLERAMETGTLHRDWVERDPDLALLRDEPRFRALLDRLS